jgi:voltage-gated potassium channel Kch
VLVLAKVGICDFLKLVAGIGTADAILYTDDTDTLGGTVVILFVIFFPLNIIIYLINVSVT